MKYYIALRFDGWHWHHHRMAEDELKGWMTDGSFDEDENIREHLKWEFYELGKGYTKEELLKIATDGHTPNP